MEYELIYHDVGLYSTDKFNDNIIYVTTEIHGDYLYVIIRLEYEKRYNYDIQLYKYYIKIFHLNNKYTINDTNLSNNTHYLSSNSFKFKSCFNTSSSNFSFHNGDIEYNIYNKLGNCSRARYNYMTGDITCCNKTDTQEISYYEKYKIHYDAKNNILQYSLNNITYYVKNINRNFIPKYYLFNKDDDEEDGNNSSFVYVNSQNHLIILFCRYDYRMLCIEEDKCLFEKKMDKKFNRQISDSYHVFYPTADDNFVVYIIN